VLSQLNDLIFDIFAHSFDFKQFMISVDRYAARNHLCPLICVSVQGHLHRKRLLCIWNTVDWIFLWRTYRVGQKSRPKPDLT